MKQPLGKTFNTDHAPLNNRQGIGLAQLFSCTILGLLLLLLFPALLSAQSSHFFIQQGLVHYELKEYDEAIRQFEAALQFPNPHRDVYTYIISSHLLNQEYEAAIRIADEGISEHPADIRLKVMKGEALIQTDKKQAISLFESVLEEMNNANADGFDGIQKTMVTQYIGRLHQQIAAEAFENNNLQRAAEHYEKAINRSPYEINNYNNHAYVLIQLEEWARAEEAVKEGLRKFPDSENLLLMQARIFEQNQHTDELLRTLEDLYLADPANMNRAVMYGQALLNANRADEADRFFRETMESHPDERILYNTLLDINRQRFNQAGVLEVLRLQMEQFPGEPELEETYGLELISAHKYQEANAWFDSLAVVRNKPEFGRLAAHTWLFEEEYEKAENEYRKQLGRWPGDYKLLGEFGRVLIKNMKIDEGSELLRRALEISENASLRYHYAMWLESGSEMERAFAPLLDTMYKGRAQWKMLSTFKKDRAQMDPSLLTEILSNMLEFVESRQKMVQSEAQTDLETYRAATPRLFQTATELNEAGDEIQEMLESVVIKLPFKTALEIMDNALFDYPESALLLHHKGALYYENGQPEDAQEWLLKAASFELNQPETHFMLGQVYDNLGHFDDAVLSFERVLTLDPNSRKAYRSLVRIHQERDKMDQLSSRWLQRYQHHTDNEVLREFVIESLHRANRFDEARSVLR